VLSEGTAVCSYEELPRDVDTVVNLAGANIVGKRWTEAYKRDLHTSRVDFTRALIGRLRDAGSLPKVWVNASAVGIYGDRGSEPIDEETATGRGFLPDLCRAWESAAHGAGALGARVVLLRLGVVLAREGGALPKMALPFRWFVGGPIGRGRFYMAWIHRDDVVGMVLWALHNDRCRGVYNATAPQPCTNLEISRAIARALGRPCLLPVPPFALRVVLGEVADALTQSQRVVPARAQTAGFSFAHPTCAAAIAAELGS
jgi:uncharacterized protein (TIGR01777 family)